MLLVAFRGAMVTFSQNSGKTTIDAGSVIRYDDACYFNPIAKVTSQSGEGSKLNLISTIGTDQQVDAVSTLVAGNLAIRFSGGAIRRVDYGRRTVCSGISYLLRDDHWGTCPLSFSTPDVEQTSERFSLACRGASTVPGARLEVGASIVATPRRLEFIVTATALEAVSTSRCGFVVLHPGELAGREVSVEESDRSKFRSSFPLAIDPLPVFTSMRGLSHRVGGVLVEYEFEGDEFEMEDQRNWGDFSFKSYVRPIRRPYPYLLQAGETFTQKVSIRFTESAAPVAVREQPMVSVGGAMEATMPMVSLRVAEEHPANVEVVNALRPNVLGLVYDPSRADALAVGQAPIVDVEAMLPGDDLAAEVRALAGRVTRLTAKVDSVLVGLDEFCRNIPLDVVNDKGLARRHRDLLSLARSEFGDTKLGAGTIGFFTEVNRNRPPADLIDFISYAVCPTVHDADDDAVMTTVSSLADMVRSSRLFAPQAEHRLSALSLSCRFNPYAPHAVPNVRKERVCLAEDDPRQHALFGASWFVSAYASAAYAGIMRVGCGTPFGPQGVASATEGGLAFAPMFHVARGFAEGAGQFLRQVSVSGVRVQGLAYQDGDNLVVWLTNVSGSTETFQLGMPTGYRPGEATIAVLDASAEASTSDANFMHASKRPFGPGRVTLGPYAVSRISVPNSGDS